jgi:parallel beta-helix repeat protein
MNKLILTILLITISTTSFGQIEIILETGNPATFESALTSLGSRRGTITIKREVTVFSPDTVPENVTLNFFNGGSLSMSSLLTLTIKGNIISSLNPIFKFTGLSSDHNLTIKNKNQTIYPEWFGSCTYQDSTVTDDKSTIQKAINAMTVGGEIVFKGNYIVSGPINITSDEAALRIKGIGAYLNVDSNTNFIKNNHIGPESPIFNISTFGLRISDLNFRAKNPTNKGIDAIGKALNFVREGGFKDLDANISNCMFENFRTAIYGEGTNLKITDNTFSACYMGVYINQASKVTGDDAPKANTRGHVIDRNRFHSIGSNLSHPSLDGSTAIQILGTEPYTALEELHLTHPLDNVTNYQDYTIRGYYNHISNNYADDCKTFFYGTVDRTKIDGNSILLSGGTAINIYGGEHGAITNNLIDGSFRWNGNQLYYDGARSSVPSGHGIQVEFANFLTIHDNQILNKRMHGIYIKKSKNSSIQSNTIKNFNRHYHLADKAGLNGDLTNFDYPVQYNGIHIACTTKVEGEGYNIQNIVTNNVIGIPLQNVSAKYGIYVGDGDAWGFVKDNFIVSARLVQPIFIESPTGICPIISDKE